MKLTTIPYSFGLQKIVTYFCYNSLPQTGFKLGLRVDIYLNLMHALTKSATTDRSSFILFYVKVVIPLISIQFSQIKLLFCHLMKQSKFVEARLYKRVQNTVWKCNALYNSARPSLDIHSKCFPIIFEQQIVWVLFKL